MITLITPKWRKTIKIKNTTIFFYVILQVFIIVCDAVPPIIFWSVFRFVVSDTTIKHNCSNLCSIMIKLISIKPSPIFIVICNTLCGQPLQGNRCYIALQPGQYLDITWKSHLHLSFDLHFDLLIVAIETSNFIYSKACRFYLWYWVLCSNNHSKCYYTHCHWYIQTGAHFRWVS